MADHADNEHVTLVMRALLNKGAETATRANQVRSRFCTRVAGLQRYTDREIPGGAQP